MSEMSYPLSQMNTTAQNIQGQVQDGQNYKYDLSQLLNFVSQLPSSYSNTLPQYINAWDGNVQELYNRFNTFASTLKGGVNIMQDTDYLNARRFDEQQKFM